MNVLGVLSLDTTKKKIGITGSQYSSEMSKPCWNLSVKVQSGTGLGDNVGDSGLFQWIGAWSTLLQMIP